MKKLANLIQAIVLPMLVVVLGLALGYYFLQSNILSQLELKTTPTNGGSITTPIARVVADEVFDLTNKEREALKLKPLVKNTKLEEAALERAKIIIETQDWSHEAGKSGVTYQKAIANSKYYNSVKGENLAKDQTTSAQVVQQWMGSPTHRANIVDPKYQEMGIATYAGKFAGQDTIVTVQLFGGYIPPNYTKEVISSWENTLTSIQGVLPSWENTRNSPNLYPNNKEKCERMITILQTRISKIQQVVTQMKANKWLSAELDKYTVSGDTSLYNEQLQLASYLNSQKW